MVFGPVIGHEPIFSTSTSAARDHKHYMTAQASSPCMILFIRSDAEGRLDDFTELIGPSFQADRKRGSARQQSVGAVCGANAVADNGSL